MFKKTKKNYSNQYPSNVIHINFIWFALKICIYPCNIVFVYAIYMQINWDQIKKRNSNDFQSSTSLALTICQAANRLQILLDCPLHSGRCEYANNNFKYTHIEQQTAYNEPFIHLPASYICAIVNSTFVQKQKREC